MEAWRIRSKKEKEEIIFSLLFLNKKLLFLIYLIFLNKK